MKFKSLTAIATLALAITTASQAAVAITNGDFESVLPTGSAYIGAWGVTATTVSEVTSGPNLIAGNRTLSLTGGGSIAQDFVTGSDVGLNNFQFDMTFRMDNISAAGATSGNERIRFRDDNNGTDLMAFRINAGGIYAYNGSSWVNVNSTTLASDTTYFLRITMMDAFKAGGSYIVALSTDGVNYTDAAPSGVFFNTGTTYDFETVTVGNGNGGGMFIDNLSVIPVPEPSITLLGGLGLLGLLRRRR